VSVTVVIPTRQGDDLTERCVSRVLSGSKRPQKIIIVSDESPSIKLNKLVAATAKTVCCQLVSTSGGVGFSGAVNTGLRLAETLYSFVVNNDCEVGRFAVENLLRDLAADSMAAAVCPLTSDAGKCSIESPYARRISKCNNVFSTIRTPEEREDVVMKFKTPPQKRTHIPWTCIMVRTKVLSEIGYLDEENFASGLFADDEWNLRATQAGWHLLLSTNAFADHLHESSTFKRLNLDYQASLRDGQSSFLEKVKVLACVLSCDRKSYSNAGIESIRRLRGVSHAHVNYEGNTPPDHNFDSITNWTIGTQCALPETPVNDQDQLYRLPRIIAGRNMCLDLMRINKEYTHLLFIDSDISVDSEYGLKNLIKIQTAMCGGFVHGRGEHGNVEMTFGRRLPYHGKQFTCSWGTCGYQLLSRVLCERYQFRWGVSRKEHGKPRSEDPAFAEDVEMDGWGEYVIDPGVTASHVDNKDSPLTKSTYSIF